MKAPKPNMTDRERILTHLACEAASATILGGIGDLRERKPQWRPSEPGEPMAGQLVRASTSWWRLDQYAIAWCVGRGDPGAKYNERDTPKIRAIGEEYWIWFFNESFDIYNGDTSSPVFFEGWHREYFDKVLRAMPKAGDGWRYRFGGIKLNGTAATLTVRPHIWFAKEVHGDKGDEPFTIELPMSKNVRQRELVESLKAGGFGTKWNKPLTKGTE